MTPALILAAVALADTLAAENAALKALDLGRAATLAEPKAQALDRFLAARATAPAHLDATQRRAADDVSSRLDALVAENKRLLEHAIAVQSRVIGLIARAVPRAVAAPGTRYLASGARARAAVPAVALSARA